MLSEGAEEFLQYYGQKRGENVAKIAAGLEGNYYTLGDAIKDPQSWQAFTQGAGGGMAFTAMQATINHIANKNYEKELDKDYNNFKSKSEVERIKIIKDINTANTEGDIVKSDFLKKELNDKIVIDGLHLDSLKNTSQNYNNHISFLEGTLKAVESKNTEELEKIKKFLKKIMSMLEKHFHL